MSVLIERALNDTSAIKFKWTSDVDFTDVTAMSLAVYSDSDRTTLVETLVGEIRGFDPAVYFPVNNTSTSFSYFCQLVITRGAESKPLTDQIRWVNGAG